VRGGLFSRGLPAPPAAGLAPSPLPAGPLPPPFGAGARRGGPFLAGPPFPAAGAPAAAAGFLGAPLVFGLAAAGGSACTAARAPPALLSAPQALPLGAAGGASAGGAATEAEGALTTARAAPEDSSAGALALPSPLPLPFPRPLPPPRPDPLPLLPPGAEALRPLADCSGTCTGSMSLLTPLDTGAGELLGGVGESRVMPLRPAQGAVSTPTEGGRGKEELEKLLEP
jgi:hypothetical protein